MMLPCIVLLAVTALQPFSETAAQMMQPYPMPMPPQPMQMAAPPMPMPSPMLPVPMPLPQARLPVVVMPYYSKSADRRTKTKKHKPKRKSHTHYAPSDTSSDDSESCSAELRTGKKKVASRRHTHEVLTPVISYMTKEGYVVYQKKIKKETARDWLTLGQKSAPADSAEWDEDSDEMSVAELKDKLRKAKKNLRRDDD